MRFILPCLKNASKAASHYSAIIEQCFQQSKHFTEAPENITPKKLINQSSQQKKQGETYSKPFGEDLSRNILKCDRAHIHNFISAFRILKSITFHVILSHRTVQKVIIACCEWEHAAFHSKVEKRAGYRPWLHQTNCQNPKELKIGKCSQQVINV